MIFLNQIIQGVLLGGYYALIACGLSFMFGVMGVINLAHGSLAVLAAYALFVLADRFGISPFLGLILVAPAMALVGWALQRLVLERSARGGLLVPVLSTFGLSIVIDNLLFEGFGADTRSLAPFIGDLSYDSWSLSDDDRDRQARGADLGGRGRAARRHPDLSQPHPDRPRDPRDRGGSRHGRPRSASTRAASMRSPPRSRWRRWRSLAPFSACARPSIHTPARPSSSSPSRPR